MGYGEFKRRLDATIAEMEETQESLDDDKTLDEVTYMNGVDDLAEKVVEIHLAMQKQAIELAAKEKDSDYKRGYLDAINWMCE